MTRLNDGFTQTSGLSAWRGSVMVKAMSVAMTARSRSAWSASSESTVAAWSSSRNTTSESCSVLPLRESGNPVTQSSWSLAPSSCSARRSSELRAGESRTASPATGEPWATVESGPLVLARGRPLRSVRPASAPQVSTSIGSRTWPASSTAAVFA